MDETLTSAAAVPENCHEALVWSEPSGAQRIRNGRSGVSSRQGCSAEMVM